MKRLHDPSILMLGLLAAKLAFFSTKVETHQVSGMNLAGIMAVWVLMHAGICVVAGAILMTLPPLWRRVGIVAVDGGLTALIIANRFHQAFFHSYISPEILFSSGQGISLARALGSTFSVWELAWGITLPLFLFLCWQWPLSRCTRPVRSRKTVVYMAGGCLLIIAGITAVEWPEQRHIAMAHRGLVPYYAVEIPRYIRSHQPADVNREEAFHAITTFFANNASMEPGRSQSPYWETASGKNLIILQVEALQRHVLFMEVDGKQVTPHLNALIGESIYFPYCFDQVERATADGETLVNLSLYPVPDKSIYQRYPANRFHSMPRVLKDHGFKSTAVFHGHDKTFYNRDQAYPSIGFQQYLSREDFRLDEMHNGLLGDRTFLEQTAEKLVGLEEPYYAFIITLTSHHPFSYLETKAEFDAGQYAETIVGDYLESMHYVDEAIGLFYQLLKEHNLLDDAVLVVFGDHVAFNYNEKDQEALQSFIGVDVQDRLKRMEHHQVPLIIRLPGGDISETREEKVGQIDLFPTIASLYGIQLDQVMGRDLFHTEPGMVVLRGGSYYREGIYYDALTRSKRNVRTGEVWSTAVNPRTINRVEEKLLISRWILETDYHRVSKP